MPTDQAIAVWIQCVFSCTLMAFGIKMLLFVRKRIQADLRRFPLHTGGKRMGCPTCRHTMHNLGLDQAGRRVFQCPRCGTTKVDNQPTGGDWSDTYVPRWTALAMGDDGDRAGLMSEADEAKFKKATLDLLDDAVRTAEEAAGGTTRVLVIPGEPRVESGPVQFDYVVRPGNNPQDWTGVFIRGDDAFAYVLDLVKALDNIPEGMGDWHPMTFAMRGLKGLAMLLDSSNENPETRLFNPDGTRRPPPRMPKEASDAVVDTGGNDGGEAGGHAPDALAFGEDKSDPAWPGV